MWWVVGVLLGVGYLMWRERNSYGRKYQEGYLSGLADIASRRKSAAGVIRECLFQEQRGRGSAYVSGRKAAGRDFERKVV